MNMRGARSVRGYQLSPLHLYLVSIICILPLLLFKLEKRPALGECIDFASISIAVIDGERSMSYE
jgi:hypothetical protein